VLIFAGALLRLNHEMLRSITSNEMLALMLAARHARLVQRTGGCKNPWQEFTCAYESSSKCLALGSRSYEAHLTWSLSHKSSALDVIENGGEFVVAGVKESEALVTYVPNPTASYDVAKARRARLKLASRSTCVHLLRHTDATIAVIGAYITKQRISFRCFCS
jgi:hypothetical protein